MTTPPDQIFFQGEEIHKTKMMMLKMVFFWMCLSIVSLVFISGILIRWTYIAEVGGQEQTVLKVRQKRYDVKPAKFCTPQSENNYRVHIQRMSPNVTGKLFENLSPGGAWQPTSCVPRDHVAVIIPYRDRQEHLDILLQNLHPFLQSQNIHYEIFVIEQAPSTIFNLGLIRNVGFLEASATYNFTCYIFHDVDKIPLNNLLLYRCPTDKAVHFASAEDRFKYSVPYYRYIGGVLGFPAEAFRKTNGYPNGYLGWGGEDDDFYFRMQSQNVSFTRADSKLGRYRVFHHPILANPSSGSSLDFARYLYREYGPWDDGLNTLHYTKQEVEHRPAYTWIKVGFDQNAMMKKLWKGIMDPNYDEKRNLTWWNINMTRAIQQFPRVKKHLPEEGS
ncbi:beta-1,4-galactosyltransferase 4 [Lingula anatina]|uniref:Beta-1,4-galactosyltransferase n=1 Tax=Lingula anatina TaxID=7574 RepID=A0A1S3HVV4_LINAN|nr:beta-1,4-galactosyltransferase 4 [Lingula anatina]|eukprot:XP_013389194.1 beta-1,4-galactosyltransferase 4 [Lingula anatina]